jgi:hypothetical protein
VQVPLARGSVMPEIASMREDFPALCHPMTAMAGISRSTSALVQREPMITGGKPGQRDAPDIANASKKLEHALSSSSVLLWIR